MTFPLDPSMCGEVVGAVSDPCSSSLASFRWLFFTPLTVVNVVSLLNLASLLVNSNTCNTTFTLSGCAAQSGNLLNISKTDKPETIKLERHHAKLRRTCTICQAMALSQRPTIAAGWQGECGYCCQALFLLFAWTCWAFVLYSIRLYFVWFNHVCVCLCAGGVAFFWASSWVHFTPQQRLRLSCSGYSSHWRS